MGVIDITITLKNFLQVVGFLLIVKAVILGMYAIWGMQIVVAGMVVPQIGIIVGAIADIVLAYLAFKYSNKKR